MTNLQQLVENLSALTVLEAAELSKLLEEKWGVSAAASIGISASGANDSGVEAAAEQSEFDVILTDAGAKRLDVIKQIRVITSLGLMEAKAMVEGLPKVIKSGVSKEEAQKLKTDLEATGATINIK